ncbi:MAG: tryptophan-rich sensory protein [Acidisphaera sp.]|nr:tryptophan-rich sensory protein [Acidisphaera sp.]MBV9811387.1 tryptophan-rich sensory protein [Acetobacteraceae bacterium]
MCLLVGAANGAATSVSLHSWYLSLRQPPLTPPEMAFIVVWNVLYLLIGLSAWLVWQRPGYRAPLRMWGWQLLANAVWPAAFFGLRSTSAGLAVIVALLLLLVWTMRRFARIRPVAAWLLAPYLVWTAFAGYLNAGFLWLNT